MQYLHIKDVDAKRWDAVARSLCEKGIREKFTQNPHLMHVLLEKTSNKTIVECANDRLWGNGKALSEESCLNRDQWITQGILAQILENIGAEFVSSRPPLPLYPFVNGLTRGNECPSLHSAPNIYSTNPMHTITMQLAAFRPTQIPIPTTTAQPQLAQTVTIPAADHSSQPLTRQPLGNSDDVQLPGNNNNSAPMSQTDGHIQQTATINHDQMAAEEMDLEHNVTNNPVQINI